jgi:hypothetical protein
VASIKASAAADERPGPAAAAGELLHAAPAGASSPAAAVLAGLLLLFWALDMQESCLSLRQEDQAKMQDAIGCMRHNYGRVRGDSSAACRVTTVQGRAAGGLDRGMQEQTNNNHLQGTGCLRAFCLCAVCCAGCWWATEPVRLNWIKMQIVRVGGEVKAG